MGVLKINFKSRFWVSLGNISGLLVFMFIPLILNIVIAVIPAGDKIKAIESKIIPGEMLAFCLSLIAPLFLLLLKTHGKSFGIPALRPVFIIAFVLYLSALALTLFAKNEVVDGIDFKSGHRDTFFWLSIVSLSVAVILRFYTDFQEGRYTDYKREIDRQQNDFNQTFRNRIG